MDRSEKLEEYKVFIEDTARFSDRRQTVSNIYVLVNSALLVFTGALVSEAAEGASWVVLIAALLPIAGIAVCVIWRRLVVRYDKMIDFRCRELKTIEGEIADSHGMYRRIDDRFGEGSFSRIEANLPYVFIGLYSALIVMIAVGLCALSQRLLQCLCQVFCQP